MHAMWQKSFAGTFFRPSPVFETLTHFTVVSYQNESFSSKWELPCLPPSSLELWRRERASRKLSFWWKTLILIGHYGKPDWFFATSLKLTVWWKKDTLNSRHKIWRSGQYFICIGMGHKLLLRVLRYCFTRSLVSNHREVFSESIFQHTVPFPYF